ncbi:unnamed protein product [Hermetia illucens]|uniref:Uncharacterized protein n=1 Tax=Hermetia illucens TaxID=343691 RepID=A0A7R8ULF5_HERIL|nr:probable GPI-anchored adhesin-like protein PGA55 [Hermetia illucens]CAD7082997.1 unnamed protein product [Hermetia illucens]
MKKGNSKTMTQEEHLEGGHQIDKSVYDQVNEVSTSSKTSAKNSGKKNPKLPTKIQQTDRRINQSNKSAIGKASASANSKVPKTDRDRNGRKSTTKKSDPLNRSTVGNRNECASASINDKKGDPEMTILTHQNSSDSLRETESLDISDNSKNVGDTVVSVNTGTEPDKDSIGFPESEKTPTAINTDLQSDGAISGRGPTIEHKNKINVNKKNEAAEDQAKIPLGNSKDTDDEEKKTKDSIKKGSCIKPLPPSDDPIERLNALRANISNALKEVKAVLDQHAPPPPPPEEGSGNTGEEGVVKFRFVRRDRKKSIIKFDEEEIICNVPAEAPTTTAEPLPEKPESSVGAERSQKDIDVFPDKSNSGRLETDTSLNKIKGDEITPKSDLDLSAKGKSEEDMDVLATNIESSGKFEEKLAINENQQPKDQRTNDNRVERQDMKGENHIQKDTLNRESKVEKVNVSMHNVAPVKSGMENKVEPQNERILESEQTDKMPEVTITESKAVPEKPILDKKISQADKVSSMNKLTEPNKSRPKVNEKAETAKKGEESTAKKGQGKSSTKPVGQNFTAGIKEAKKCEEVPTSKQSKDTPKKMLSKVQNTPLAPSAVKETTLPSSAPKQISVKKEQTTKKLQKDQKEKAKKSLQERPSNSNINSVVAQKPESASIVKTKEKDIEKVPEIKSEEKGDTFKKETDISIAAEANVSPKKQVEICANVEHKALEILTQTNKKTDKKSSPMNDAPVNEVIKSVDKVLPKKESNISTQQIISKPDQIEAEKTLKKETVSAPVKIEPKAVEKIAPNQNAEKAKATVTTNLKKSPTDKEITVKPPVSLRAKRGSLVEAPKISLKENILKPKRASIGSESDLVKIAAKSNENILRSSIVANAAKDKPATVKKSTKGHEDVPTQVISTTDTTAPVSTTNKTSVLNVTAQSEPTKTTTKLNSAELEVSANSSATLKSSPSSQANSKNDSSAEIIQTQSNAINAPVTQPIPIKSNVGAKIDTVPSQTTLDVIKPLISSADKLVSSESVELSNKNSVVESSSEMTVVKKDTVPNIASKQSLEELKENMKDKARICEPLDNNLNLIPKISVEPKVKKEQLSLEIQPIKLQNGEVQPSDTKDPSHHDETDDESVPKVPHQIESRREIQLRELSAGSKQTKNAGSQTPPKLKHVQKIDKHFEEARIKEEAKGVKADSTEKVLVEKEAEKEKPSENLKSKPPTVPVAQNQVVSTEQKDTTATTITPALQETPISEPIQESPLKKTISTSTEDLSAETESTGNESDSKKPEDSKKSRKTKKVIIKRVKRRLSLADDAPAEPEICEKPIAEPLVPEQAPESEPEEEEEEEPSVEEPPVPKGPKSCLIKRSYDPGDIVMYADRVRKTVKWKKATVLDKITDISYKLEFEDGTQKPAHISYIKKYTDKKVQFGGKEYLEIDYEQEYESSSEEEPYSIWARA